MRSLVTGGLGFIGQHLIASLQTEGDDIVCLGRREVPDVGQGMEYHRIDLADGNSLKKLLQLIPRCDRIFHLGAMLPQSNARPQDSSLTSYLATNVGATEILLDVAEAWGVNRMVYASSIPVIGKPTSLPVTEEHPVEPLHPYLVSKYQAEVACEFSRRLGRVPVTSLRISSPYGPEMQQNTVLPLFLRSSLQSIDIEIYGQGHRRQNFVHVSDVVNALMLAGGHGNLGLYNVAGSTSVSMIDLAEGAIQSVPGTASRVVFSGIDDPQEDYRWDIDIDKASRELGFRPATDLMEGLRDLVFWMQCRSAGTVL